MDSWQSNALLCVPKNVRKIRKKLEFPTLLLVKSCLPPVDTLKQISNKENVW